MPVLREKLQAQVDARVRPRRPRAVRHQRHQRRADAGDAGAGEPGRRSDRFRSVLRDVRLAGGGGRGKVVYVDTYPDFRIDLDRVAAAITPRTKMIVFNSPANPTGVVASEAEVRGLAELAARAERGPDQRRDLSRVLLRRAVRLAGPLQSADAGDRRLQQDATACRAGGWGSPTGRRPSSAR